MPPHISLYFQGLSDVENLRKLTPHLRYQNMNPKVKEILNSIGSVILRRARFGELKVDDSAINASVLAEKLIIQSYYPSLRTRCVLTLHR